MPYFDIGFMPQVLEFIGEIIGSTEDIKIDTNIGGTCGNNDDSRDIIYIKGSKEKPITYKKIHKALNKMFDHMFDVTGTDGNDSITGPHINYDDKKKMYEFSWDT